MKSSRNNQNQREAHQTNDPDPAPNLATRMNVDVVVPMRISDQAMFRVAVEPNFRSHAIPVIPYPYVS